MVEAQFGPRVTGGPKTVYDLIAEKLGVEVDFRFGEVTQVGAASEIIARLDPGRAALVIVNLHATQTLTVRMREEATATAGIRLNPAGGSMSINWVDDLIMPALDWYGIGSGANTSLYIIEAIIK